MLSKYNPRASKEMKEYIVDLDRTMLMMISPLVDKTIYFENAQKLKINSIFRQKKNDKCKIFDLFRVFKSKSIKMKLNK